MTMKFGDKYLVAHYLDLIAVARYAFAYSMVNLAYGLTVLVSNAVLLPHIMAAQNEDDLEGRNRHIVRATKLGIYGLLVSAATYAVIPAHFWALIAGHPDYERARGLALALTAATLLGVLGNPASFVLLAKRKTRVVALIDVAGTVSIVALNALLLPAIGLYGAAVSAAVSLGLASALKHLVVWRQKMFDPRAWMDLSDEKWVLARVVRFGL